MKELAQNEMLILLSIWRLKENAYGVTIRKNIAEVTGKTIFYGSLYNSLERLAEKGFVRTQKSEPTGERGGRTKIIYNLTNEAKSALKNARDLQQAMWSDIPDFVFDRD